MKDTFTSCTGKKKIKTLLLILVGAVSSGVVSAATPADILGTWINQAGDGLIEIATHDGVYEGTIRGGTDGQDRKDSNNPDPALRDRSLQGLKILGNLTYRGNNKWVGGWIYDPNNGKTYKCKLKLIDNNTLQIRGYIGVSVFGRTETWVKSGDR